MPWSRGLRSLFNRLLALRDTVLLIFQSPALSAASIKLERKERQKRGREVKEGREGKGKLRERKWAREGGGRTGRKERKEGWFQRSESPWWFCKDPVSLLLTPLPAGFHLSHGPWRLIWSLGELTAVEGTPTWLL